jgi:hypothetical protein
MIDPAQCGEEPCKPWERIISLFAGAVTPGATALAGRQFCRRQHPWQMPWSFFLRLSSIFLIASSAELPFWTFCTSWPVGCR